MPQVSHLQYPNATIDTATGVETSPGSGYYTYKGTVNGAIVDLDSIQVDPSNIGKALTDIDHPFHGVVGVAIGNAGASTMPEEVSSSTNIIAETVSPAAQRVVPNIFGLPADMSQMISAGIVDPSINFGAWLLKGFQGEMPKESYIAASDPKKTFLGAESIAKGIEKVSEVAVTPIRQKITAARRSLQAEAAQETTDLDGIKIQRRSILADALIIPEGLLSALEFDMTPVETDKYRKNLSLATQVIVGAPVDGKILARAAEKLAKAGANLTAKYVSEVMNSLWKPTPGKAAAVEAGFGLTAAGGMIGSMEALEAAFPDAPQWIKGLVAAGGGVMGPLATAVAGPKVLSAFGKNGVPILNIPAKFGHAFWQMVTPSGIQSAAAKAIQASGTEGHIANARQHLLMAQLIGRTMDADTRAAYTLPQMARNEARILEAEIRNDGYKLEPEVLKQKQELFSELMVLAKFQEGQLATVFGSPDVASDVLTAHSGRVLDRADTIKNSLSELLKVNLGGEVSPDSNLVGLEMSKSLVADDWARSVGGVYHYAVNRQRALMEGKPLTMSEGVLKPFNEALEGTLNKFEDALFTSKADAEEMVTYIRNAIPEDASPENRARFDVWIKRILDDSYSEMSNLESLIWSSIDGINVPKTKIEFSKNADGVDEDIGPALMMGDQTVTQYFADRVRDLGAGTSQHQPKELFQLAGRKSLVDKELAENPNSQDSKDVKRSRDNVKRLESERQDTLESLNAAMNEAASVKEPQSLLEFLSDKGGLIDDGGDLKAMDAQLWHQGKRFNRLVVPTGERNNKQGKIPMTMDDALIAAEEAGFISMTPFGDGVQQVGINDLLRLIGQELRGDKIYNENNRGFMLEQDATLRSYEENIRVMEDTADQLNINLEKPNPKTGQDWTIDEVMAAQREIESLVNPISQTLNDIDNQIRSEREALKSAETNIVAKNTSGVAGEDGKVDLLAPDAIKDRGELGVRLRGSVNIGRSAQEVQDIRSNLIEALSVASSQQKYKKVAAIKKLMSELDDILAQNFPELNRAMVDTAKQVSALKGEAFQRGGIGETFKTTSKGALKVDVRALEEAIIPTGTASRAMDPQKQLKSIVELQNALTRVRTNEPDSLFLRDENGNFTYNSEGADLNFHQSNPPRPFMQETVDVSSARQRKLGLRVEEGTPATQENIDLVNTVLWRRFQKVSKSGDPGNFDTKAAQKFIDDNHDAIKWLDNALSKVSGKNERSGFQDLTAAEARVQALTELDFKNLDKVVESLTKNKVFDDPDVFSEIDFRGLVERDQTKRQNLNAAATFLEDNPMGVAKRFIDNFLSTNKTKNPNQALDEIIKVLENGKLDDGSNPAWEGFRTALSEELFKRFLSGKEDGGRTGQFIDKISKDTGENVKFIDGEKILNLVNDDRMSLLLQKIYGSHAPDLLRKFATSAMEVNPIPSGTKAVPMSGSKLGNEAIATMGRLAGLFFASKAGFVNSLVAAGVGRRVAVGIADELKGKGVLRHIGEGLLNAEYGLALLKKFPSLSAKEKALFEKNLKQFYGVDRLNKRTKRLSQFPGALLSTGDAAQEMPLDQEEQEVSSLQPSRGPKIAATNVIKPIAAGSSMNGTLMAKLIPDLQGGMPSGTGAGSTAQETADRRRLAFGATDPVFANKGGLVSLCGPGKPRQMVS